LPSQADNSVWRISRSGRFGRRLTLYTDAEFARYLRYALASTSELEYHAIAARDIGVITTQDFVSLSSQAKTVRMMLYGLLKRLDK